MATSITPGIPDARKQEALAAFAPAAGTYKCALIKAGATVGKIALYSDLGTNEVASGNGYTAGGQLLAGYQADLSDGVAGVDWADAVWDPSNLSADGAVIYETGSGKVVVVLDFGQTVTSMGGPFRVSLPATGPHVVWLG